MSNSPHTGKVFAVYSASHGLCAITAYLVGLSITGNSTTWAVIWAVVTVVCGACWHWMASGAPAEKYRGEVGWYFAHRAYMKLLPALALTTAFCACAQVDMAATKASSPGSVQLAFWVSVFAMLAASTF